ncbi:MAG: YdhR family protein [Pseudomonadota bacterium]|nr:YdhR family protein [Pseudomonadota bacterium]
MEIKAFVYTELQNSLPFDQAPWRELNPIILEQPGFINKTWLSGAVNNSVGGFYAFDSIENAQKFVTAYFPDEVRNFNVAHTTRIFDASVVEEASRDMNSVHFGATLDMKPGAFVYTEVQLSVPFDQAPWRELNPTLKQQPGILSKTWLSGLHTNTPGGIYAFDTLENATNFAVNYFPTEAANLNAAFTTRIFDGSVVEQASKQLKSPFYR